MSDIIYHLRDRGGELAEAWDRYFQDIPEIQPSVGDIFEFPADAVISPANGFGFMDGGIDRVYSEYLGWHVQDRLRTLLREQYHGELPVGWAVLIETVHPEIPYMISAPTMRAPTDVSQTLNAYLAFRAALRVIQKKNIEQPGTIKTVLCPGLATGTGEMSVEICAKQMHTAYIEVIHNQPFQPSGVNESILEHYRLLRIDD